MHGAAQFSQYVPIFSDFGRVFFLLLVLTIRKSMVALVSPIPCSPIANGLSHFSSSITLPKFLARPHRKSSSHRSYVLLTITSELEENALERLKEFDIIVIFIGKRPDTVIMGRIKYIRKAKIIPQEIDLLGNPRKPNPEACNENRCNVKTITD